MGVVYLFFCFLFFFSDPTTSLNTCILALNMSFGFVRYICMGHHECFHPSRTRSTWKCCPQLRPTPLHQTSCTSPSDIHKCQLQWVIFKNITWSLYRFGFYEVSRGSPNLACARVFRLLLLFFPKIRDYQPSMAYRALKSHTLKRQDKSPDKFSTSSDNCPWKIYELEGHHFGVLLICRNSQVLSCKGTEVRKTHGGLNRS